MGNGFLSQEEIDALLNGSTDMPSSPSEEDELDNKVSQDKNATTSELPDLSDIEKDLLGEIGNISMGSASTALSTVIGQPVNITTPVVTVTTLRYLKSNFAAPNVALQVKFTSGIVGGNLLLMKLIDAAVIANLMMGGDGSVKNDVSELTEIEESAVSEAMNQMIGSAATSMATMFMREVNISPPVSNIWNNATESAAEGIGDDEPVVNISFSLTIGSLVNSSIMQLLPMATAKKIVAIMMGQEEQQISPDAVQSQPQQQVQAQPETTNQQGINEKPAEINRQPNVEVRQATFQPLNPVTSGMSMPNNIDLILDVPLEISVVLGRSKKNIKDILELGTGSLIELDRLAEEPVEILVNGKKVAYGEVVVVDENFGVRITNIVSNEERIKSLGKNGF